KGIDPSLYFDGDLAYILYNSIPPDDKPLYDGHRTIRMYAFDWKNLRVNGEEIILVNGGSDFSKKPVWIEAPHIIKKDGWYYLYCAEGGTFDQHSEVAFRSRSVKGPFIPNPRIPILTQRDLDPSRPNPVTSTGHAEIFQTLAGEWYAVFLGCRPYSGPHYNTGRETFLTPVSWADGWPVINPGFKEVRYSYPVPQMQQNLFTTGVNEFAADQPFLDHFDTRELNNRYSFLRTPSRTWYNFKDKKGYLSIELLPETCSGTANIAMVADRQNHLNGQVSTRLRFQTQADHEKAGLLIFQNENHYYFLCKSADRGQPVVQLFKGPGNLHKEQGPELLTSIPLKKNNAGIILKAEVGEGGYSFYFSIKKDKWLLVRSSVDREFLSSHTAGGFTGVMYGMYATSTGQPSVNRAMFDWFEKIGL
ncbi:MAG TPA: family 43 glycosylhydrolase, partial [Saprospiraceae bacterium]|nr:family 43 glycosylhydrolase [Saprospiraceae bacterium]